MNRNRVIWVALAAALLPPVPAAAQAGAGSTNTTGSTMVGVRIAIATRQDFVLGSVRLRSAASVDPLSRSGGARAIGRGIVPTGTPFQSSEATFIVTGAAGQSLSIAMPATVSLARVGGSQVMTVAMTTNMTDPANGLILAGGPGGGGTLSFSVGGRIVLTRDTVAGDYRGMVSATAQYN